MTVGEYEAHFYESSRHATSILGYEYEKVHCFIRGLRHHICILLRVLLYHVGLVLRFVIKLK